MEKSTWTGEWTRPRGQVLRSFNGPTEVWECVEHPGEEIRWSPKRTPALWLRIADTPPDEVFVRWGPMRRYSEETRTWDQTIRLLQQLRTLWKEGETVNSQPSMPLVFMPGRGAEAILRDLGDAILRLRSQDASANDIGLSPQRANYTWVIQVRTLRGMVLLDAGRAVHQHASYLRCRMCQQWFELVRKDQIYCSSACRAAAFRAAASDAMPDPMPSEDGAHVER